MTSGARTAASAIPAAAVCAVQTRCPSASSATLHTLSRSGSSSMMRTRGNLRLLRDRRRHRHRAAEPRPAARGLLDPDPLPVGLDEGLGDGQAEPGAGVASAPGEEAEYLLAAVRLTPGPRSVTDSSITSWPVAAARIVIAVFRRAVPDRVVQQVGQARGSTSTTSTSTGGSRRGSAIVHPCPRRAGSQVGDTAADQAFGARGDRAARLKHPCLDAAHVEQILDQRRTAGRPGRRSGWRAPAARPAVELDPGVGQGGRRRLYRRERRPQVMRDRRDERLGQPGHLLGQRGAQRLLAQLGAFDRQRDLVGEQQQRLALVPDGRIGGQASRPTGRPAAVSASTSRSPCSPDPPPARVRVPGTGSTRRTCSSAERFARGGHHFQPRPQWGGRSRPGGNRRHPSAPSR